MAYDAMINNILKHDFEEDSMLDETNFGANESDYVLNSINQIIKEKMLELCQIWVEIGIPKSKRVDRLEEVKNLVEEQIADVLNTVKETETKTLNDLKDYRVTKLKEINKILNDLKLPPFELPSNCNLFNTAKILHYKFDDLNKLKKERVNKWTELKTFKSQLTKQLGTIEKAFNLDTGIPSEEELMKLQSYVNDLQREIKERTDKFKDYEKKLKVLFDYLEYNKPSKDKNEFERYFFDNKSFILSDKHMKELDEFRDKLQKQFESNKLTKSLKMEKLNSLWKKLDISDTEQDDFRQMIVDDCKPSTLKLMQFKIDELEELKRQNISKFIDKLKPEIEEWWVKCCVSEQKKASFVENYFEANDELALEKLEEELEWLQRFYCENEILFLKYHRWNNLTRRLDELEMKSKDPNRLYNNRGGALLKEEKERKELKKQIPRIENELKQLTKEWSTKHSGQIFKIYDKPIEVFFEEYYAEKQIQKENEKEKKITKQHEIETQSRFMINSPCRSTSKVKRMIASQTASSTKRFKLVEKPLGINRNQSGISKSRITSARKGVVKSLKPEFVKKVKADVQIELNTIINESQFRSAIIDSKDILNSTNIKTQNLEPKKYSLRKKIR